MENVSKELKMEENKPRKERSPFQKLFVGNLSFNTKEEGLRSYFEKFGEIEEIVMLNKKDGRPAGAAFVVMAKEEDANTTLRVLGAHPCIDGRETNLQLAYINAKPPLKDLGFRNEPKMKNKSPKRLKEYTSFQHPYCMANLSLVTSHLNNSPISQIPYMVNTNACMVNQMFVQPQSNISAPIEGASLVSPTSGPLLGQTIPGDRNQAIQPYAAPMLHNTYESPLDYSMVHPTTNYESSALSSNMLASSPQTVAIPYYKGSSQLQYSVVFVNAAHVGGYAGPTAVSPTGSLPAYCPLPTIHANPNVTHTEPQTNSPQLENSKQEE